MFVLYVANICTLKIVVTNNIVVTFLLPRLVMWWCRIYHHKHDKVVTDRGDQQEILATKRSHSSTLVMRWCRISPFANLFNMCLSCCGNHHWTQLKCVGKYLFSMTKFNENLISRECYIRCDILWEMFGLCLITQGLVVVLWVSSWDH